MQQTAKLAVIVPSFNEAKHIKRTLQTLAPWRAQGAVVIVVDGGSSDQTKLQCAGLIDGLVDANKGRAIQMNSGAQAAASQFGCNAFVFVHADTWVPDNGLTLIMQSINHPSQTNTAVIWGRFDVQIIGKSKWLHVIAWFMNIRSRMTSIATGDQAIFMNQTAFDRVGGFPNLPLMEDIQMSENLTRHSKPLCLRMKVSTSGRRWEERGIVKTVVLMWCLRFRYWMGDSADILAKKYR